MHESVTCTQAPLYLYLLRGYAVECHGCLMAFTGKSTSVGARFTVHLFDPTHAGAAYWASSFNDSVVDFIDSLPKPCFYTDDVWIVSGWARALCCNLEQNLMNTSILPPPPCLTSLDICI